MGTDDAWVGLWRNQSRYGRCDGGNRDLSCKQAHWEWADGTPVEDYTNWAPNEPTGDSDCARMNSNGLWKDIKCETQFAYICEQPMSSEYVHVCRAIDGVV